MKFFLVLFLIFNCAILKREKKILPSEFDYQAISKNYFVTGIDEPFPLTVQKGNNLYSSISKDNRYLFFASDINGNFDIYVRDLKSSLQVPITSHPSLDTKPAISPDGKKLIFVSERQNTNKDLFLIELDTEEYIKDYLNGNKKELKENLLFLKTDSRDDYNDQDPIWSPDSKKIFFSSDRLTPGVINILSFDLKTDEIKLITKEGGVSPRISENGIFLTYISYKDNSFGEVYLFNLSTNEEKRITNDNYINTSPSISDSGEFIYYTIIQKDSNKNGKLDLNDNSLIARIDLKTGESKNLTSDNFSIFDTKITNFNKGSLIFSASLNNSIDIYFIPSEGLIPKKNSILEQFNFATKMKRKESTATFFLALDAVDLYFQNDTLYPIFQCRVLDIKAEELKFRNRKTELNEVLEKLKNSKDKKNWEIGYGFYLKQISNEKNFAKSTLEYYNSIIYKTDPETLASILYLTSEDLENRNENLELKKIFKKILVEYPKFYRIKDVERKLAKLEFKENHLVIPENFLKLLNEEKLMIRELRKVLQDIETIIYDKVQTKDRILYLNSLLKNYPKEKSKKLFELIQFLKADSLNRARKFEESNQVIDSYLDPIPEYPIDCRTNPFCKKPVICENNPTCMKSHILKSKNFRSSGSPSKSFEELRIILENYDSELGVELEKSEVERSFKYFENKAAEFESRGDFKQTAFHYFFNVENMYLLKYKNLFVNDLYKDFAVYYQKKMVDSILRYALKQAEDERNELLTRLNLLGKENLNLFGRFTSVLSSITKTTKLSIIFGDIKDLESNDDVLGKSGSPDDAVRILDQHFNLNRPRSRPVLYLASLYGYSYYLINRAMIYDSHFKKEKSYTPSKREEILRDLKNAENELKWIIYADPLYSDAYQLLGWLYQYIGLARLEFGSDKEIFDKYFSEKNFEENVFLYSQILDFLGDIDNKKILSDLNLNLANNYHLLKKYSKANEHYEIVEKLGKEIKTNIQFENYKQEAIYYFHYGRLLFNQKKFSKAIFYFNKSKEIYYSNEFDIKTKQIINDKVKYEVHNKLVLLHVYLAISYSENLDYVSSINQLKKALALNYNSEIIDQIIIHSLLAYNYQKVEKYHLSEYYLELIEKEYNRKKKKFNFNLPSMTDYLFSDRARVIGEGRIVEELNPEQFLLLAKGIRIQNLTEQGELNDIPEIIENRKKIILNSGIDKSILGEKILLNTEYKLAFDLFYTENYLKALEKYNSLLDDINKNKIKTQNKNIEKRKLLKRKSFTLFKLVEREILKKEEIFQLLIDHIQDLKLQFESEKKVCESLNEKKLDTADLNEFCFKQINKDWYNFDPLLGFSYFYLGELFTMEENYSIAFKFYGKAYDLIKNPSSVEQDSIGLQADLFSKTDRMKLKANLNSILFRVDEIKEFNESIIDNENLSLELHNHEVKIKLDYLSLLNKFKSANQDLKKIYLEFQNLENEIFTNLYFLIEVDEEFIYNFFGTYEEILLKLNLFKEIHSKEEKKLSIIFLKNFLNSKLIFEEKKLEGLNQRIRELIRNENLNQNKMKQKINRREKLNLEVRNLEQTNKELELTFKNIQKFFPEKKRFFEIEEKTKPDKIFEKQVILKLKTSGDKFLVHYVDKNKEEDFIFPNSENNFAYVEKLLKSKKNDSKEILTIVLDEKNSNLIWEKFDFKEVNFAFMIRQINSVQRQNIRLEDKIVQKENSKEEIKNIDGKILEKKSSRRLNASLYDSDILNTEIYYSEGNIFTPSKKGNINFREFAEKNSFLSLVELENVKLNGLPFFQTLGAVEIIQSANIPLIHLSKSGLNESNFAKIGYLNSEKQNSSSRLKLSKEMERIEKNREAMNYLNEEIYLKENLDDEIELARLKSKSILEVKKFVFFERLLEKYSNDKQSLLKIYDSLLEECYIEYSNSYCRFHFQNFHKELKKTNLTEQERKQNLKKVQFLFSVNRGVLNLQKEEYISFFQKNLYFDEYLVFEKLTKLFSKNLFLDQAEYFSKKLISISKNEIEKQKAEEYLNQILIQKISVLNEKFKIPKNDNSIYSLGLRNEWTKFESLIETPDLKIYDDSILNFKKKIYTYWKKVSTGESIFISSLRNQISSTKRDVYSLLPEVDKKILFLILKKSISKQNDSNLNEILFDLIDSYKKESKLHKEFMVLGYLEALFAEHDLKNFYLIHEKYKTELSLIKLKELKNRYNLVLNKANFYEPKISFGKQEDKYTLSIFEEIKQKPVSEFYSILNQYLETNKNFETDETKKKNFFELIHFMKEKSIHSEEDATEVFIDLSFYLDRIQALKDKNKNFPKIEKICSEILKKIPKNQKMVILVNSNTETYFFEITRGNQSGEIALKDNSKLLEEILNYNQNLLSGKIEKNKKDLLDQKLKTILKTKKNEINYIYLAGSLFLSPIEYRDEDKLVFITRPDLMVKRKSLNLKDNSTKKLELILIQEEETKFLNRLKNLELKNDFSQNKLYIFDKKLDRKNIESKNSFELIQSPFLIGNNYLVKNSFSKNYLQNSLQKLDESFEGFGVINLYEQELNSFIYFTKTLSEEKDFVLNLVERFQFAMKEQKIKFQNDNDYIGYRIYSNVFLE